MRLRVAIVVLFCIMIIVMPVFTSLLHLENIGLKFLALSNFSSESAIFGWVKLYYFAIAIVGLWVIGLFTPGEKEINFNRADIAIGLFLLMGLIMLIAVPHRFDSSRRILELISGFSLYFVAKNVFTNPSHKKAALISLATAIGIIVVLGIVHYAVSFHPETASSFILPPISPESVPWEAGFGIRATSTLGNPNFLADILIFAIPLWIASILFIKKNVPVFLMALLAISTFVLLLLTNSWGGYMGVIISIIVMSVLYLRKRPRTKYKATMILVILACLISTVVFFSVKKGMALGWGKTGDEELVGVKSRYVLWESSLDMIKRKPLTGWGLGNFFAYSNIFISKFSTEPYYEKLWVARPEFLLRNPGRVHNEFLSLMVELGIPGLILFLLIFGLYVYEVWRGWRPGNDPTRDIFIFGATAGIFAVWAQSLVSFPFRLPVAMTIICTCMGIGIQGKAWKTWRFTAAESNKLWVIAAVPITVLGIYLMYQNTITAVCLHKFRTGMKRYEANPYRLPQYGKLPNYPDDIVLDNLMYCAKHWHLDHDMYFKLSLYLLFNNRLEEAEEALAKLEYVQPYHEKTHLYWGEYWRKKGDYENAVEAYRKAIKYEARYIRPQILLVEMYLKMGKLDEAQEVINMALKYEPEAKKRLEKKRRLAEELRQKVQAQKAAARERADNEQEARELERKIDEEAAKNPVNIHIEDVLFYWMHNAQAITHVTNGDFDSAEREFETARRDYLPYAGIKDVPIHSFHAEFPIFEINRRTAASLRNKKKAEDIREWTKLFYGPSEWDKYDSLNRVYKNTFITAQTAARGAPPYENIDEISRLEKADESFQEALHVLREIAKEFTPEFVTCDGLRSRETYNRIGILFIQMAPPRLKEAIESFHRSAQNLGNLNLANYNICLVNMINERDPRASTIPILNVNVEREILTLEMQARREVEKRDFGQAANTYLTLLNRYPLYAPAMIKLAELHINNGDREQAKSIIRMGLEIFPTHPELNKYARQLGVEQP